MEKRKGIFLMITSAFSFALMAVFSKKLGTGYSLFQKLFIRQSCIFAFLIVGILISKRRIMPKTKKGMILIFIRTLLAMGLSICYFYAVDNLTLTDATLLNKLSPFFVTILATIFLKEEFYKKQFLAMLLMVVGAVFIIKPTLIISFINLVSSIFLPTSIFSPNSSSHFLQYSTTSYERIFPSVIGLAAAIFAAGSYTMVRYLKNFEEPDTIVFWFAALGMILLFPPMVIRGYISPQPEEWIYFIGTGFAAMFGQLTLSHAYKFGTANEITMYQYMSVIFSAIFGIMFFDELPNKFTVLGSGLIFLAAYINYKVIKKYKNN